MVSCCARNVTIFFRFGNTAQVSAEGSIVEVTAAVNKAIAEATEASKQQPVAADAAAPAPAPAAAADAAADDQAAGDGDALASTQVADAQPVPVPQAIHIDLAKALHAAWEQTEKGFEGSVKRCVTCHT